MTIQTRTLFVLGLLSSLIVPAIGHAIEVTTKTGAGLDGQWQEISAGVAGAVSYGFNGATAVNMNARYNGYNNGFPPGNDPNAGDPDNDDRNEFWVIRFDLSGQDKSQIGNVSIKLTADRDSNLQKDLRIWGLNAGTAGLNTFAESSGLDPNGNPINADPNSIPGFVRDFDMTTQSVDASTTTYLGDFLIPNHPGDIIPVEGDFLTINQDVLTNTGPNETSEPGGGGVLPQSTLQGFLRSLGSSDMAVFLIGGIASNGQVRVSTKESLMTSTGVIDCTVFECAPILTFEEVAGIPGDFDGDEDVDGIDFLQWQRGETPGNGSPTELAEWETNYGTVPPLSAIVSVPEPATGIMGISIASLLLRVRQRRRGADANCAD